MGQPIDRRRFLGRAGLATLMAPALLRPARAQGSGLTVMDWTGYEIPELHQPYIAKHGASPDITVFSDLEEAWQKIAAGFRPDVMHADHWQIPARAAQGLFEPWDTSRVANFPNLLPELVNLPTLQIDGRQIGMPVDWGHQLHLLPHRPRHPRGGSWASLWDPALEGRIAMTRQMNDAVASAASRSGSRTPSSPTPRCRPPSRPSSPSSARSCASTGPTPPSSPRPWPRARSPSPSPGPPSTRS
jgi:spermidine/putrescine transport system substrate-binding protein